MGALESVSPGCPYGADWPYPWAHWAAQDSMVLKDRIKGIFPAWRKLGPPWPRPLTDRAARKAGVHDGHTEIRQARNGL